MTPWTPSHVITLCSGTRRQTILVALVDGTAYTREEWAAESRADWERDSAGAWTFQGRAAPGGWETVRVRPICSELDCRRPVFAAGRCEAHYRRRLRAQKAKRTPHSGPVRSGPPLVKLRGTALRVSAEIARRIEARAKREGRTVPEVAREMLEILTPTGRRGGLTVTSTTKTTHYAVIQIDTRTVYGTGRDLLTAIADAEQYCTCDDESCEHPGPRYRPLPHVNGQLSCVPCTPAAAAYVRDHGGQPSPSLSVSRDGVCLRSEES